MLFSVNNRMRFLLEIIDGVSASIDSDRFGVRLSPFGQYMRIHDSDPMGLFTSTIQELSGRSLAYLHLIEGRGSEIGLEEALHEDALNNAKVFRPYFDGCLISAAAYTPLSAARVLQEGDADAVAFGRHYISNPELADRIASGVPLTTYDRATPLFNLTERPWATPKCSPS